MDIKDAYNGIYLDETAKKRILDKLNASSEKKEERRDTLMSKEYHDDKHITEAVIIKEKKILPRVVTLVASLAAVVGLVIGIGFSAKGILGGPNTSSVGTTITTTKATATATPKAEGEIITISRKEFEDYISVYKGPYIRTPEAEVIYASNELVIVNDGNGMVFYDYKNHKCLGVLDTNKYGINHMGGSPDMPEYTEVKVSESGQYISFANVKKEKTCYLFDLKNLTLEKGKTLGDMPVYDKTGYLDDETMLLIDNTPGGQVLEVLGYGMTEDGTYVLAQYGDTENPDVDISLSELQLISVTIDRKADGTRDCKVDVKNVFED